MTLHVELVSPEQVLYSDDADMVVCRTTDGEIAFLTGHAEFVGALGIGEVRVIEPGGDVVHAAVHGGFVEVSNDRVTILSDVAELANQIDVARAQQAADRAEVLVREGGHPEAEAALRRARVRLEVAQPAGSPGRPAAAH
ncbi:MAG TPA: ATP synthase F1 subunit epsilon [Acidimicrobiales bacterium]|nr:ATP synthase F1 subunit epsilon [Acidimicrobiales bacterium]